MNADPAIPREPSAQPGGPSPQASPAEQVAAAAQPQAGGEDGSGFPTLLQREPMPWDGLDSVIVAPELMAAAPAVEAPVPWVDTVRMPPPSAAEASEPEVSGAPASAPATPSLTGTAGPRDRTSPPRPPTSWTRGPPEGWARERVEPSTRPARVPGRERESPAPSQTLRDREGILGAVRRERVRAVLGLCAFLGSAALAAGLVLRAMPPTPPLAPLPPMAAPAAARLPELVMVAPAPKAKPGRPPRGAPAKPARAASPTKPPPDRAATWDGLSEARQ